MPCWVQAISWPPRFAFGKLCIETFVQTSVVAFRSCVTKSPLESSERRTMVSLESMHMESLVASSMRVVKVVETS